MKTLITILISLFLLPQIAIPAGLSPENALRTVQQHKTRFGTSIEEYLNDISTDKSEWKTNKLSSKIIVERTVMIKGESTIFKWVVKSKGKVFDKSFAAHEIMPTKKPTPKKEPDTSVEKFGGLQSAKKDGTIVIDCDPNADQERILRESEIAHKRNKKREQAIIRQSDKDSKKRARLSRRRAKTNNSSSQKVNSSRKSKTSAERDTKYYRKKLRELEQEERDHVGPLPKYKYKWFREQEKNYKRKISNTQ